MSNWKMRYNIVGLVLLLKLLQCVTCFVNLSFNKTADMSSSQYSDKWLAGEAVDGDVSQNVTQGSCAVTSDNFHKQTWWRVDLGDVYVLNSVKIYYRKESGDPADSLTYQLSGFSIYVADTLNWWIGTRCYLHNNGYHTNPGPSDIFTVPCNATGRYVSVYKQRNGSCTWNPITYYKVFCTQFYLCEVQVLSCEDGTYGEYCRNNCSGNCLYGVHCNKAHGGCDDGCAPGYRGFYCTNECNDGVFGLKCLNRCGNCFDGGVCDHKTGLCASGCAPGWKGNYCNETCQHGTYGENCNYSCSDNCKDTKCITTDGYCEICFEGWMGHFCEKDCKEGTFGSNCSSVCGNCNGVTCNHINGSCPADCSPGWKGVYCNETCNLGFYGNQCLYTCKSCAETCHHVTGRCLVYDKQTSDEDTINAMIAIIVTCALVITVLSVALLRTCLRLRHLTSPNVTDAFNSNTINHEQGRVQLSDMNVNPNDAVNETSPKPVTQASSRVTYEDLVMSAPTDSNTYESLQSGRKVTYTNTEVF